MWIDLTCPVELWQYSLPKEDSPECTFVLNNLSDKVVASVQATLICYGEDEKLLFRQIERVQGLNAGAGERFNLLLLPSQWEGVKSVDLVIEKVWYDDATIWRRGGASPTEYRSNALPAGRKLDQLRFVAGADATGYPEVQEDVWLCVCGRANDKRATRCCRCERNRETVFASYTRENIEQLNAVHEQKLLDVSKNAREDASRLAEEREAARRKKARRKHVAIVALSSLVVLAAATAALLIWGLPTYRYHQAQKLLESGAYADAKAAFASMPGYADADALRLECDYRAATACLEAGTTEDLQAAADSFAALGDYLDSAAQNQAARYALAEADLSEKRYDAAAAVFQGLGDYRDSAGRLKEATRLQAHALYDAQSFTAASVLFEGLGDYEDAPAMALECAYEMGKEALTGESYDSAVEWLVKAGDTRDAAELLKEARYRLAEQKSAEGDFESAGGLYQQAGDYGDATLRANDCLYQLAHAAMSEGDYAKAQSLFDRIASYLDSETLSWKCVYQQAKALRDASDFAGAAELFETVPLHSDASEQAKACRYEQAAALSEAGESEQAIAAFEQAGDYKDSATQLKKLRYAAADAALTAGEYENAATLFEALGTYSASEKKLKECRYQLALQAFEAKRYEQAASMFAALGSYSDSRAKAEEASLARAAELKEAGSTDEAQTLLQSLEGSREAKRQLNAIAYEEATRTMESSDIATASALFLALGDFEDAQTKYQQCEYALAAQELADGAVRAAGDRFLAIAGYEDAKAQSEACYAQLYGEAADRARAAYQSANWAEVVAALDDIDRATLPIGYADLATMYESSCYDQAEALYAAGDVYEALAYYERVPDYKDVSAKKLQRRCYLILGSWENDAGDRTAVFRRDGSCQIFGTELRFRVDGYLLLTGASIDALAADYKISSLSETSLSLRDMTDGRNTVYRLAKVAPALTEAEQNALAQP